MIFNAVTSLRPLWPPAPCNPQQDHCRRRAENQYPYRQHLRKQDSDPQRDQAKPCLMSPPHDCRLPSAALSQYTRMGRKMCLAGSTCRQTPGMPESFFLLQDRPDPEGCGCHVEARSRAPAKHCPTARDVRPVVKKVTKFAVRISFFGALIVKNLTKKYC